MMAVDICENCGKDIALQQYVTSIEDTQKNKKYAFCDDSCAQNWAKKNSIRVQVK